MRNCVFLGLSCLLAVSAMRAAAPLGIFESHADVGTVLHPGAFDYDAARDLYRSRQRRQHVVFDGRVSVCVQESVGRCDTLGGYRVRGRGR